MATIPKLYGSARESKRYSSTYCGSSAKASRKMENVHRILTTSKPNREKPAPSPREISGVTAIAKTMLGTITAAVTNVSFSA
mmetsp:Transcript_40668/g.66125  ORF Transcript_40668/g.66125 Transcript_40668/m.66125 type:complete len:82 (+) Transcript_40668:437-682(+)